MSDTLTTKFEENISQLQANNENFSIEDITRMIDKIVWRRSLEIELLEEQLFQKMKKQDYDKKFLEYLEKKEK